MRSRTRSKSAVQSAVNLYRVDAPDTPLATDFEAGQWAYCWLQHVL